MKFRELELPGAYVIEAEPIRDSRGFLARIFSQDEFAQIGFRDKIVQMNHTSTLAAGIVRGMHYQMPPFAECKVVKCIRGRVFDVVVDIRAGSETFLKWTAVEISEENMNMMYVPRGFAHGFQSLVDRCELIYLHTAPYAKDAERGLRTDDPELSIKWPLPITYQSDRDLGHPLIDPRHFKGVTL
ncbi:MAG: dTDP-4-dehydrorhamnose 3,5-epimerase [Planctomycetes bacterium]|nr:dTDP-4-dehydrorhamnose 3,5-epimerase [Planctomycetota bacterium]